MMFNDRVTLSKEVRDVKLAQWEGFKRLAKRLPDHHILALEMVRTRNDETAAVFTIVRNGEPFQTVVMGDSRGRVQQHDCGPREWMMAAPVMLEAHAAAVGDDPGDASPDGFTLAGPPPKQPPEPGVVLIGTAALALVFGVGDQSA